MDLWQHGTVAVDDATLWCARTGGALPPLLLAHGFSDDGGCWASFARRMAPHYDVVMVDARGHGRSSDPHTGYDAVTQARDLAGVIDALGLERPLVLGHSMGATTALALAGSRGDRLAAIMLGDPPPVWRPATGGFDLARMHDWIVSLKRCTRDELIARERTNNPAWPDDELGSWADAKLRLSLHVIHRADGATPDWPALLAGVRCPALLITGDPARGALVEPATAAQLHDMLPQLAIAHIAGAGHCIRRDRPTTYEQQVRQFVAHSSA
jgi:pimeloyl-ACP methyl ester carboxylesterase